MQTLDSVHTNLSFLLREGLAIARTTSIEGRWLNGVWLIVGLRKSKLVDTEFCSVDKFIVRCDIAQDFNFSSARIERLNRRQQFLDREPLAVLVIPRSHILLFAT